MRELHDLVDGRLWDVLFDNSDAAARRAAFVELVRSTCDSQSCALWRDVDGKGGWFPMARAGAIVDEREVLLVAALHDGARSIDALPHLTARGPFGASVSPWYLTLVGPLDEESADLVDALGILWDRLGGEASFDVDDLPGPVGRQSPRVP